MNNFLEDNKDVINAYRRVNEDASDSKEDFEYLHAIENKLFAYVGKMVLEKAKARGYVVGPVFHGTDSEFNVFKWAPAHPAHVLPFGFHFSTTRDGAEDYGNKVISAYLNIRKLYDATGEPDDFAKEVAGRRYNPGHMTAAQALDAGGTSAHGISYAAQQLERYGYDGVKYIDNQGVLSYVVLRPAQIKSSQDITRDDSGKIIPLSKRFDANSTDIRE